MKRNLGRDERNIGDLAEKTFETWMAQTSVTCNPVERDREGWDYFLQFPFEATEDVPLDLRRPRTECVVQVKGIGVEGKVRKSVRLSNWEKLTKSLLPAFFVVIDFKRESEPQEAFLIHVDELWINRVTKRLRELSPSERSNINNKRLYLTWNEQNRLASLDGPTIVTAMKNYIGRDIEHYSDEKRKLREEAGEPIAAELIISFAAEDEDDMWAKFVDLIIGEQSVIKADKAILRENIRFEIPAKEELFESGGTFQFTDHKGVPIQIVFCNEDGNLIASFAGQAVSPRFHPIAEQIPEEHLRERAVFQFGRVLIHPSSGRVHIGFRLPEKNEFHSLNDLGNLWRLVTLMYRKAEDPCFFEIQDQDGNRIFFQKLADRLTDQVDGNELLSTLRVASVVDNAWYLAKHTEVPLDTRLSMDQIIKQQHLLNSLRELLDVNMEAGPVTGTLHPGAPLLNEEGAVVFIKEVLFGDLSVLICLGLSGKPEFAPVEGDGSTTFTIRRPRLVSLDSRKARQDETELEATASSLLDATISNLEARDIIVIAEPFKRKRN